MKTAKEMREIAAPIAKLKQDNRLYQILNLIEESAKEGNMDLDFNNLIPTPVHKELKKLGYKIKLPSLDIMYYIISWE